MIEADITQILTPWQPVNRTEWHFDQVKYHYDVILGKMLQNSAYDGDDIEVPYLKAQHVQWDAIQINDLPTMWASPKEIDLLGVKKGDLIVCEGGEVGRAAIVHNQPPEDCIIQNALHLVRPKPTGNVRFLRYLLQHATANAWLDVLCNRATIAHFTAEKFREMRIWLPDLSEQHAIADYLDRATAKIDTLIAAKQRLLDLLAEKRRAMISQAVTHGVSSSVRLADMGIPWVESIPSHWQVKLGRYLFNQSSLEVQVDDEIVTCFRDGEVTLRSNRRTEGFTNAVLELGYQGIKTGQLVLHSMDAFAGAIGVSDSEGKCTPEYIICDPATDEVFNPYYALLLREMALRGFIQASCPAVRERAPRVRFSDLKDMLLPLPPVTEQKEIVSFIKEKLQAVDRLISIATATIELLHERRAVLISEAVTGRL